MPKSRDASGSSPGVAWAHDCCSQRRQIAVLPLPLGEVPRGRVPVTVAGATIEIAFITEESQHVDFFRSVIALENADEAMFERLAPSAFPTLDWADNVWQGLGDFSRPYIERSGRTSPLLGWPKRFMVRRASTSIAPATRVICRVSCRHRSVPKLQMRMAHTKKPETVRAGPYSASSRNKQSVLVARQAAAACGPDLLPARIGVGEPDLT